MLNIFKKFLKREEFYPPYPTRERKIDAICGNGMFLLSFSGSLIIDKSYWLSGSHIFEFIKIPSVKRWRNVSNIEVEGTGDSVKVRVTLKESIRVFFEGERDFVEILGIFSPDLKRECCLKYYRSKNEIEAYHSYDSTYFLKFEGAVDVKLGNIKFFEDVGYPTVCFANDKTIDKVEFSNSTNTLGGCFYARVKTKSYIEISKKGNAEKGKINASKEEDVDKAVVLSLVNKDTGLPIAAPEYENPYLPYQSSGGYGYVWFRDMLFILSVTNEEVLRKATRSVERIVEKYSLIPHRVWAWSLEMAPSWADGPFVESPWNYQIDQLASTVAFLSKNRSEMSKHLYNKLLEFVYDDTCLPVVCQNCWEDRIGIFTHTVGTVLKAYMCMGDWERARKLVKSLNVFWDGNRFVMGLEFDENLYRDISKVEDLKDIKLSDGKKITLLDSGTFELIDALVDYLKYGKFDENLLEMCLKHLNYTIPDTSFKFKGEVKGLLRKGKVKGIIRYEGDLWRRNRRGRPEKVWSVSTLWGSYVLLRMSRFLRDLGGKYGEKAGELERKARDLYELFSESKHPMLAEQYYSDGTPDSAMPLGWSHALRYHVRKLLQTKS